MTAPPKAQGVRVDQFYTVAEARMDRWRSLLEEARSWDAAANHKPGEKERFREAVSSSFQELLQWEDFFAYPGKTLLKTLAEHIDSANATGATRLAQLIGAISPIGRVQIKVPSPSPTRYQEPVRKRRHTVLISKC